MDTVVDELVDRICERVRYEEFNSGQLQQICYEMFTEAHPPEPAPNPGSAMIRLDDGANERDCADAPDAWRFFIDDVSVTYDHTTRLQMKIAAELARMVRERLRQQPFELVRERAS